MSVGLIVGILLGELVLAIALSVLLSKRQKRALARQRNPELHAPRVDVFLYSELAFSILVGGVGFWLLDVGMGQPRDAALRRLLTSGWFSPILGGVWAFGTFLGVPALVARLFPAGFVRLRGRLLSWRLNGFTGRVDLRRPFALTRQVAWTSASAGAAVRAAIPHLVVQLTQGQKSLAYHYEWSQPELEADPVDEGELLGTDIGGHGRVITERLLQRYRQQDPEE